MKKRSEQIRETIGHLIYEQQMFQQTGNDAQLDRVQARIDTLRSKLMTVEIDEKNSQDLNED